MPKRLPVAQMVRKVASDMRSVSLLSLRWILVGFVWLAWLPFCTRHIWRSTIRVGDQLTSNGSTHLHELANMTTSDNSSTISAVNTSLAFNATQAAIETFLPFTLEDLTAFEAINKILTEICEGQIIASLIIVVFVVIFLIREWIVQNNANLLDETPDFLGNLVTQGEEMPREPLRVAAIPHGEVQTSDLQVAAASSTLALHDPPINGRDDVEIAETPRSPNDDAGEPRTLVPRQPLSQGSDWDSLRAQAVRNTGRAKQNVLPIVDGVPSINDSMTTAELRAMRRQAILRATTERMELNSISGLHNNTTNGGPIMHSDHHAEVTRLNTTMLDAQLAGAAGVSSVENARYRHARTRSAERKSWETAQELIATDYPDSPMPMPLPNSREEPEELKLPSEARDTSISDVLRAKTTQGAAGEARSAEELDSASVSDNSRILVDDSTDRSAEQDAVVLSPAQLEGILHQIRTARTPADRTSIANEALLLCREIGTVQANRPEWSQETKLQLQTIARFAIECGTEGQLNSNEDSDGRPDGPSSADGPPNIILHAQNVADVPVVNAVAVIDQNGMRDLQAAANNNQEVDIRREEMDDDIEGFLEVIGVRGPISALLQNSMIVVVMVTAFVVFGICLPHVFGRALLVVVRSPRLYLVKMPLQISRVLSTELLRATKLFLRGATIMTSPIVSRLAFGEHILSTVRQSTAAGISVFAMKRSTALSSLDLSDRLDQALLMPQHVLAATSSFVANRSIFDTISKSGATLPDRLLTIVAGYTGLTTLGAIYLKANRRLTTGEQGRQIELIIRSFLRQTGFVMKFIVILGIELVVFPFYCGILLDAVFLPAFHEATMLDRLVFFAKFPFTSMFLHWLIGTVYMFNFALFVSMCRTIVRPGVLFFIRDPNDPGFNPIKDILERPVRNQMRKIGVSVLIYGALTVGAFGSVVWIVTYGLRGVTPLQWNAAEPVFEVPFDLLIFQILLPLTIKYVQPHKKVKAVWTQWFISTSKLLRLSHFMMGKAVKDEERYGPWIRSRLVKSTLRSIWHTTNNDELVASGSYKRVPGTDSLPMRVGKDMIMNVTKENDLLDSTEFDETKDDPNYVVVYVPDHFRIRLYVFFSLLWAFAAALTVSCTIVPLVFGRRIAQGLSSKIQSHDLFAYFYGVYALGAAIWALSILSTLDLSRLTLTNLRRKYGNHPGQLKDSVLETGLLLVKWIYLVITLFVIIPTLLGLCLESYVVIPLGVWLSPNYTLTVHLVHDWIVGLVYVKIIGRTAIMMPTSSLGQALNNTVRNDWRNNWWKPEIRIATFKIILPIIGTLAAALLVPMSIGALARNTLYRNAPIEVGVLIYRMSFPAAFISAVLILLLKGVHMLATAWRGKIRDSLYLKGRQLHNFGELSPPETRQEIPVQTDEIADLLEDFVHQIEVEDQEQDGQVSLEAPSQMTN